jgi:hypothetical protein
VTRKVNAMSLVTFEGGQYSVPHQLAGQAVYVRRHGGHVVITHSGPSGPAGVARHLVTTPGSPRVDAVPWPSPHPPPGTSRSTPITLVPQLSGNTPPNSLGALAMPQLLWHRTTFAAHRPVLFLILITRFVTLAL